MPKHTPRAPVVDVECDQALLDDAVQRDSGHCFVAEAVKAAYPDAQRVAVDLQTIRFTDRKKRIRCTYLTPRVAQYALVNFDQGNPPETFSFRLKGGHVTAIREQSSNHADKSSLATGKNLQTPEQHKQRKAAAAKGRAAKLKNASLRVKGKSNVPERVGGQPPPTVPGGRRRAFGLRGLDR